MASNELLDESADYLKSAGHQAIRWQPLNEDALVAARMRDRPILLVIGVSWGRIGNVLDAEVFSDPNVVNLINRQYLPVRVDGVERPQFINALLPVSREKVGFLPGIQMWFLDHRSRPYAFWARTDSTPNLTAPDFLKILLDQRELYDKRKFETDSQGPAEALQQRDLDMLAQLPVEKVNFQAFSSRLLEAIHPLYGGFPRIGVQEPRASALRYLLMTGDDENFRRAADKMLTSPLVDVLDGGFFRLSNRLDWTGIEYGKVATQQADLMTVLAIAGVQRKNPYYRYLATRAFDSLVTEFVRDGAIMPSRADHSSGLFRRDARCSFSPRRLLEILPDASDREWAIRQLGLDVSKNPQASPYFADAKGFTDKRLEGVLEKLRKASPPAEFATMTYLDVEGSVIARMIETSRILNDSGRLEKAEDLLDNLESYRNQSEVRHAMTGWGAGRGLLGDHLAYADAQLQLFLSTGRIVNLTRGAEVLSTALRRFSTSTTGWYKVLPNTEKSEIWGLDGPELYDSFGESSTARLLRLCHSYGILLKGGQSGSLSSKFLEVAGDVGARFSSLANQMGPLGSSLLCSLAELEDDTEIFVVGPNAIEQSQTLNELFPGRLIAPAVGTVRLDLQARGTGIYVERIGRLEGPYKDAGVLSPKIQPFWNLSTPEGLKP